MNGTDNLNTNNVPASNEYVFRANGRNSNGDEFNPNDDIWRFPLGGGLFDFTNIQEAATYEFFINSKKLMKVFLETGNYNTARTIFIRLNNFIESIENKPINLINESDVTAYLMRNNNLKYLAHIKMIVNKSVAIKAPVFSEDACRFISNLKLADNGGSRNEAVISWDPEKGAMRPAEDQLLIEAINNAFEEGTLSLRQYCAIRLIRGTGMRPISLSHMKICDVRDTPEGMLIRIPMAKQRGATPRSEFMPWKPITEGLARIVRLYIQSDLVPRYDHLDDMSNAPLFNLERSTVRREYDGTIDGHMKADTLKQVYTHNMNRLKVVSPITGEEMVLNPTRERHTFATQLAMNGATADEIAINMGHSSNLSCEAYIDATIDHFQSLERHVGQHFVPIADRFLGRVVKSANDTAEFELYNDEFEGVGSCSSGGCNAVEAGVAPQACYVCRKFNAWSDGPHEELLKRTIQEQQKLLDEGHAEVAETKTNIIIAITDLIEAIRQKKDAA